MDLICGYKVTEKMLWLFLTGSYHRFGTAMQTGRSFLLRGAPEGRSGLPSGGDPGALCAAPSRVAAPSPGWPTDHGASATLLPPPTCGCGRYPAPSPGHGPDLGSGVSF